MLEIFDLSYSTQGQSFVVLFAGMGRMESTMRDAVLIIEDMEINRMLIGEIFRGLYNVLEAENGKVGLEVFKKNYSRIAAIILDLEMPVMNGYQFLEKINLLPEGEKVPIIVVTAEDKPEQQLRVLEFGVQDVIEKPYHNKLVQKRVSNAVSFFEYRERLEQFLESQSDRIEQQQKTLNEMNEKLIDTLSSIVEFRDLETGEHIKRIKTYTQIMCEEIADKYKEYGLTKEDIAYIVPAAAMHDIGKIAIPDAILFKPGRLTEEEFNVIKSHTLKGDELLSKVDVLSDEKYMKYCRNIALYHHEKYDGKGYPMGLKGEDIPIEAQVVSIADIFDALVSKRVYKDAFSPEQSRDMIVNGECGKFSDKIIDCFMNSFERFREIAIASNERERMLEAAKHKFSVMPA